MVNGLSEVFDGIKIWTEIFFGFCPECWYRLGVLAELSWAQLRNKQITCVKNKFTFSSGQKYKNIFVCFLCKWRLGLNHFGFYWPLIHLIDLWIFVPLWTSVLKQENSEKKGRQQKNTAKSLKITTFTRKKHHPLLLVTTKYYVLQVLVMN